jgi:hypothetical protein
MSYSRNISTFVVQQCSAIEDTLGLCIESYSRQDFIFVVVFVVASLLDLKYVVRLLS